MPLKLRYYKQERNFITPAQAGAEVKTRKNPKDDLPSLEITKDLTLCNRSIKKRLSAFLKPTPLTYLATIAILISVFLTHQLTMASIFDSDTIFLASLYQDVLINKHSFFAWHLTPAPYFFPDMLVFFIIHTLLLKNVFFSIMAYAIFQCCCALFLAHKITALITKNNVALIMINIVFLLTLIFLVIPMAVPYRTLLLPTFHFGTIINSLALFFFALRYLTTQRTLHLIFILLFSAFGASSDLLFIIWCVIPIAVSGILLFRDKYKPRPICYKLLSIIAIGCLVGVGLKYSLVIDVSKDFVFKRPDFSLRKIQEFIKVYLKIFHDHPVALTLVPLFYISVIGKGIRIAFKNTVAQNSQHIKLLFLSYFVLFSAFCSIANILIIKNPYGIAMDIPYFRYIATFFLFPIFFSWLPFDQLLHHQRVRCFIKLGFYAAIIFSAIKFLLPSFSYQGIYMPETVRCFDTQIRQYNANHLEKIQYGISGYWQAKLTTMFSKEHLVVVSYWPSLERQLIITTPVIYRDTYDFAIVSYKGKKLMLDEALLEQINGKPYSKFYCDPKTAIIIYGKNSLKVT